MTDDEVDHIIAENLAAAAENDYDFSDWGDEEVALDMMAYASDVEDMKLSVVTESIRRVRSSRL